MLRVHRGQGGGGRDLLPTTPRERAEVDRWTAWQSAHFGAAVRKVAFERIVKKLVGRGAPDENVVQAGVGWSSRRSQAFSTGASATRSTFAVGSPSPTSTSRPTRRSRRAAGWTSRVIPKAKAWLGRMVSRESVKKTLDDAPWSCMNRFEALVEPHRAMLRLRLPIACSGRRTTARTWCRRPSYAPSAHRIRSTILRGRGHGFSALRPMSVSAS